MPAPRAPSQPRRRWVRRFAGMAFVAAWTAGAGWVGHRWGWDWPSGVLGLLSFAVALATGLVPLRWLEEGAAAWVTLLPLFFVPPAADAVMAMGRLGIRGAVLAGITVLTVTTVLAATGLFLRGSSTGGGPRSGGGRGI
jgi:holin-like protein